VIMNSRVQAGGRFLTIITVVVPVVTR